MHLNRILMQNLVVALAYFIFAQLLLIFTVAPLHSALLWVPAGIAMATVLLWGYALLPAVFIGNFLVGISLGTSTDFALSFFSLVGVQAALHAFFGRWLLVRSGCWPSALVNDKEIFSFFILTGLLAAVPAALSTVALQNIAGTPISHIVQNFLVWAGGSALGVILITPVMLALFAQPRSVWQPRLKNVALPLTIMLLVVMLIFVQTRQYDQQVNQQRFSASAELANTFVESTLNVHRLLLQSMRAYFLQSEQVSAAEFAEYVAGLRDPLSEFFASLWIDAKADNTFYLKYLRAINTADQNLSALSGRAICRVATDTPRCQIAMQNTESLFVHPVFQSLQTVFPNKVMFMQGLKSANGMHSGIVSHIIDSEQLFKRLSDSPAHQWVEFQVIDRLTDQVVFQTNQYAYSTNATSRWVSQVKLSDSVHWQISYLPSAHFLQAYPSRSLAGMMLATLIIISLVGIWLMSISGRVAQIKQAVNDKTLALQQNMKLLGKSEKKYRRLIENIKDEYILYTHDKKGFFTYVSPSVASILGYSNNEILDHYSKYMSLSERNNKVAAFTEETLSGKTMAFEVELVDKQGQLRLMAVKEMPATDEQGEIIGVEGILHDITEQRKSQLALEKLSLAVEHSPNAIIITDKDRLIEYVNPKFTTMTGYLAKEATGKWPMLIRSDSEQESVNTALWETVLAGHEWRGELANHKKNGEIYWAQELIAPMLNAQGEVTHVVITQVDVTEARRLNEETSYQASHDLLTGLINRREFDVRLERVIESAKQSSSEHALCFMDLDQFKVINDTCGHIAGDELLRQVGRMLQAHIRVRDTIARLGGDEFVILMEHCSIEQAYTACEEVLALFEDFRFHWEDYTFTIGASIGLTVIDNFTKDGIEAMRNVDNACYAAKDSGRNRVEVHTEDSALLHQRRGEIQWSTEISQALDEDRFLLFAQPIQPVSSPDLGLGYEILLRLRRRDGSLSPPGAFLPAAERYNSITRIDRWVVNKTVEWLDAHLTQLDHIDSISINLSGLTMGDELMLVYIHNRLKEMKTPASKIKFEITETAAIANLTAATRFIESLKSMGVGFALDDFGSGLSSFAYLKNLQVDSLKIDGMFVKDMLTDPLDFEMVKSINQIGHVMGLKTIAEFVESTEILDKLTAIGIDYAQGYAIGRPAPIDTILLQSPHG